MLKAQTSQFKIGMQPVISLCPESVQSKGQHFNGMKSPEVEIVLFCRHLIEELVSIIKTTKII